MTLESEGAGATNASPKEENHSVNNDQSLDGNEGESKTPLREQLEDAEAHGISRDQWPIELIREDRRREDEEFEKRQAEAEPVHNGERLDAQSEETAGCYQNQLLDGKMPLAAVVLGGIVARLHLAYGEAFPSIATLAKRIGKCPNIVRAMLKLLVKHGHLVEEPRAGKSKLLIPIFQPGHFKALP